MLNRTGNISLYELGMNEREDMSLLRSLRMGEQHLAINISSLRDCAFNAIILQSFANAGFGK